MEEKFRAWPSGRVYSSVDAALLNSCLPTLFLSFSIIPRTVYDGMCYGAAAAQLAERVVLLIRRSVA